MILKARRKRADIHLAQVSLSVIVCCMAANGAAAADAVAQGDAPLENAGAVRDVITVTAQKREESIQDIPMSINAYSGDQLRDRQIHDISDMQYLTAGLQVSTQEAQTNVALRGVGSDVFTVGTESGVAVHRDGVYLAQRAEIGLGLFDVKRVEVLRGPQGTLYGRNATGGAVNFISNTPTAEFDAGARVTVGNYDLIETEGFISGPLIGDKLLGRVAYKTSDHDGYTPNIFNGDRLDDRDFTGIRGTLRYEPSPDLSIDIIADFARERGRSARIPSRGLDNAPLPFEVDGGILPEGRVVNLNDLMLSEINGWGVASKVAWDLGGVTLSSLSAYRETSKRVGMDFDGGDTSLSYYGPGFDVNAKQFSEELTLSSSADSKLQWIFGAYYFHGHVTEFGDIYIPFQVGFTADPFTTDAYAVFGEVSYPILDRLTLSVGARYSYEDKAISGAATIPDFDVFDFQALDDEWDSFSPKGSLIFAVTDGVSAYVTVGRGFKAGGYNGGFGATANPIGAFNPEEVTNYEGGIKSVLFDGRMLANVSVFHMDYSDLQVLANRVVPPGLTVTAVQNAASSRIRGVEFEIQASPIENLSFDLAGSYLDATFGDFPDAVGNGVIGDASGNRVLNAPKWATNAGVTYTAPLGDWGFAKIRGEHSHKGRVFFDAFEDNFFSQAPVDIFNASVTLEDANGNWTVSGWINNISDERVASNKLTVDLSGQLVPGEYLMPPRTYGISVGYNF